MSKWSDKYKKSIDCDNPKGFSQKAHCAGKKKTFKEVREYMMTRGFSAKVWRLWVVHNSFNYRSATTTVCRLHIWVAVNSLSASQKFAVNYKGSKNVGKQQTMAVWQILSKQINKEIKVTAKDV